jgi:hypothetical protein
MPLSNIYQPFLKKVEPKIYSFIGKQLYGNQIKKCILFFLLHFFLKSVFLKRFNQKYFKLKNVG